MNEPKELLFAVMAVKQIQLLSDKIKTSKIFKTRSPFVKSGTETNCARNGLKYNTHFNRRLGSILSGYTELLISLSKLIKTH